MKITKGDWINGYGQGVTGPSTPVQFPSVGEAVKYHDWQEAGSDYDKYPKVKHTVVSAGKETIAIIPLCRGDGESNANLIADAGTVANDTGYTPSQLVEQKADLLVLCKATVYCNSSKAGGCKDCPLYDRCAKEHGLIEICKAAIASTK